jgi:hypothetical protein
MPCKFQSTLVCLFCLLFVSLFGKILTIFSDAKGMKFFFQFAKSKNSDPLDAEKWYSISRKDLLEAVCPFLLHQYASNLFRYQGGKFVIKHYGNRVTALRKVFPELNLKPEKFYQYKGVFSIRLIARF